MFLLSLPDVSKIMFIEFFEDRVTFITSFYKDLHEKVPRDYAFLAFPQTLPGEETAGIININ